MMEANFLYLSCITNSTTKEYETKKSLFDMRKSRTTLVYNKIEMVRRTTFIYSSTCRKAEHVEQPDSLKSTLLINSENKIKVYPNPANDQITISYKIEEHDIAELILDDIWGRTLQHINLPSYAQTVNTQLTALLPGIYIYKYILNGNSKETGKLIISK